MKVIVAGAGQVGFHIARQLAAEQHDVVVIDQSAELVRRVGDSLDVQAFVGFGSHPDVLQRAGAADVDMIIAVTAADEVNMVTCQVAHSLFNVPTTIAIRSGRICSAGIICRSTSLSRRRSRWRALSPAGFR